MLENAAIGDVAEYRQCLEELQVVRGCDCGCSSLFFEQGCGGLRMLADAYAVYPDALAGLLLWGRDGRIHWLEIYDWHPGANRRFPELADLCTFVDYGRRQLERG